MKRLLVLTPLTLLALATPVVAGGGCHTGKGAQIAVQNEIKVHHACFFAEAAHVAVGDTVTWFNASGLPHNISGPGIDFADLPDGSKHSQKFDAAGVYPYACTLHVGMSGVVLVGDVEIPGQPKASAAAVAPVADTTTSGGSDGGSPTAWIVGGAAVLVAAGVVLTFARREGRVPLPAR